MTPDELEAANRKYDRSAVIVLRLSSGRFAIFNRAYELARIVERWEVDWRLIDSIRPAKEAPVRGNPHESKLDFDLDL